MVHGDGGNRAQEYLVGANVRLGDHLRIDGQLRRLVVEEPDRTGDVGNGVLLRLQLDL